MTVEEQIADIISAVEPDWRPDFLKLIQGQEPSESFLNHFESNPSCQRAFEEVLKLIDAPWVGLLQSDPVA